MNTENPYYDLYVKETKAHNACALREQSLLKDVEFAGREMERLARLLGNAADELDNYIADCENYEAPEEMDALRKLAADCRAESLLNTQGQPRPTEHQ